jgi:hypothetical protein
MPSTFKSLDLFNSGPHRFALARQGQALQSELFATPPASGTRYLGLVELQVIITGRLIAANETALWTLRDAVTAQLLDPPSPGTLIDPHGRTWTDMSFVTFIAADRTDRGRVVSLGYEARFVKFREYPQSEEATDERG